MQQPDIHIGILFEKEISFTLNGNFKCSANDKIYSGNYIIVYKEDTVILEKEGDCNVLDPEILFVPVDDKNSSFELHNVTIGIGFHWERKEHQSFKGALRFIVEDKKLTAINVLPVEKYLISVISSEMSATSSLELLKAHAVISRSWLLAQIEKGNALKKAGGEYVAIHETEEEYIRWYDREDHLNFDVCADDHCQRYQGITRASTPLVEEAVNSTAGLVLTSKGKICDTRFSKCCGGVSETFENVWEPVRHPYLQKVVDLDKEPEGYNLDLSNEMAAQAWIRNAPPAFCNTNDKAVLSQVLNDYDQETPDFYRWKVRYSQQELSELIARRSGINFGNIIDLIPVERGVSGRLIKLEITGTTKTLTIGKELEIRKTLSESHLYSSAFVVDKEEGENGLPAAFTLTGAGWGHGVGLCQIGAAVMGAKGYQYNEILFHYFRGAALEKRY